MKKINKEIAKLISSSGDLGGASWEELIKIRKLVELFKSYARSLVPDIKHYDNDDIENSDSYYGVTYSYKEGWNECREEILSRIERD